MQVEKFTIYSIDSMQGFAILKIRNNGSVDAEIYNDTSGKPAAVVKLRWHAIFAIAVPAVFIPGFGQVVLCNKFPICFFRDHRCWQYAVIQLRLPEKSGAVNSDYFKKRFFTWKLPFSSLYYWFDKYLDGV